MHIASIETADGENHLPKTASFKAFQSGLRDRCDEPPVVMDMSEVGSFRFFGS